MVKLAISTALAAIVTGVAIALYAAPTSANNGPHGNYTLTTNACAACHRAHTAVGDELLKEESVYALCTSCHGGVVQTDVVSGVRTGDSAPLNGGGFVSYQGEPVTSSHTVEGLGGSSGQGTAWGGASSGTGVTGTLKCTSCHNPHGSTNYRILRDSENGYPYNNPAAHRWVPNDPNLLDWVDEQVLATVDDNFDYAFTASDCVGTKCKQTFTSGVDSTGLPDPTKGMNAFCATCHKSYLTKSGSAGQPSTTVGGAYVYPGTQDALDGHGDIARYRHAVARLYTGSPGQPLRFAAVGTDPTSTTYSAFGCLTCHYAHGTNAEATGNAAGVSPTNDSALLFYDNRGVCVSCHQRDKLAPTPTPTPGP